MPRSSSTTRAASATCASGGEAPERRHRRSSSSRRSSDSTRQDSPRCARGRWSWSAAAISAAPPPTPARSRRNRLPAVAVNDEPSRQRNSQSWNEEAATMMRPIVSSSLKYRLLVVTVAAVTMVFGFRQLRNAPVEVLPEFTQPAVEIQTEALGLSAEEVEQLITLGLEQDLLNGVPWLESIRSESVSGLSSIVLTFKPGTDLMRGRQMVSERLTQAFALPHVSRPPTMLQPMSSTSRVMMIGLSSQTLSLIQMSVLARWTIGPRLLSVPGVANVAIWGQRDRQLQVLADPKKLLDKKVSLLQVLETTGNSLWVSSLSFVEASTPGTGGFIDTANQRIGIRHLLPIVSPEGLAQVPIEGTKLVLGDVATIREDHQPLIGDAVTNEGTGLLLVVEKFPGANPLVVTRAVEAALDELKPGMAGLDMNPSVYRPADFIEAAVQNVGLALLAGLLLVLLVFVAFWFE